MKFNLLTFLIFLDFSSTHILRNLFKKNDIPDEFLDFLNADDGLCIYLVYDDFDRVE